MGIENTAFGKFQNHIYEHYLPYLNGLNTIIFAIIGILFELDTEIPKLNINTKTIGWLLFAIVVFLTIFQIKKQVEEFKTIETIEKDKDDEIAKLKTEKGNLDVKIQVVENKLAKINSNSIQIVELHLAYLAQKLNLTNNERITLYKFINDEFYILGRYSMSNERSKRSRKSYKKEGLIYKAWNESSYFKNSGIPMPDVKNRSKFRRGYYKVLNEIATIDEDTVWNMKMKSRSFYIKALKDLNGLGQTSILVFESVDDKKFEQSYIDSIFNEDEEKRLVAFVEKIDWDFQKISNASEIGF